MEEENISYKEATQKLNLYNDKNNQGLTYAQVTSARSKNIPQNTSKDQIQSTPNLVPVIEAADNLYQTTA